MFSESQKFNFKDLKNILGIGEQTLREWCRTDGISQLIKTKATGTGKYRQYSYQDLLSLQLALEMKAMGFSVHARREAIKSLISQMRSSEWHRIKSCELKLPVSENNPSVLIFIDLKSLRLKVLEKLKTRSVVSCGAV